MNRDHPDVVGSRHAALLVEAIAERCDTVRSGYRGSVDRLSSIARDDLEFDRRSRKRLQSMISSQLFSPAFNLLLFASKADISLAT